MSGKELTGAHPEMVFLPNICVLRKYISRRINHMPVDIFSKAPRLR